MTQDSLCDKTARLSSLHSGGHSLGIQSGEDHTDEQPNFNSSSVLPEEPKKLKTVKKNRKKKHPEA